jgi:hypothetical protein
VHQQYWRRPIRPSLFTERTNRGIAQMAESIAQNRSQVLAAKRWMADEAGMERARLSPAEYVAYRMKVSAAEAEALVAAVYALEEDE